MPAQNTEVLSSSNVAQGSEAVQSSEVSSGSKSSAAYELLKDKIVAGEIQPGERLVLAQLAQEYDMSVVPIREAIRRLEAEGFVVYERNVGARVAALNKHEYFETMAALAIVEGAATGLAVPFITPEILLRAKKLNDGLKRNLTDEKSFDAKEHAKLNHEFHRALYESCPNLALLELVQQGWGRLQMVRRPDDSFSLERARLSVVEHEQILRLIEQEADAYTIEKAVREHRLLTSKSAITVS